MDVIYIHGLKVDCVIGVWEWEQRITQCITIDLDLGADISRAVESDDLESTLSYKGVASRVRAFAGESGFKLVETLAEEIANILLKEFSVPWCRVRIDKGAAVRGARSVGVTIERGNRP